MAINFFLTDAGRNALNKVGDVASFGGELTHLAVGTSKFDASVEAKNLTSLKNELARFSLNGGGVDTETGTLRFVMSIEPTLTMEVFEMGIYLSDGTLLAVASTTEAQSIMSLHANVVAIVTFGFVLTDVNLKNVTIKIDPNTPIAVMLMNQHSADEDPHPQYGTLIRKLITEHNQHDNPHPQYAKGLELVDVLKRIETLENRVVEDISVGELFITTKAFASSEEVSTFKKYGKWQRLGNGHALVARADENNTLAPEWMHHLGATAGEYQHQLSLKELPSAENQLKLTTWVHGDDAAGEGAILTAYRNFRSGTQFPKGATVHNGGEGYAHNIIQPSLIVDVWVRIDDGYKVPTYTPRVTIDKDFSVPGIYTVTLQPNETVQIIMIGAGGGGGASRKSNSANYPSSDGIVGGSTQLILDGTLIVEAPGGKGGTQGVWGNGSSYTNGEGGNFVMPKPPEDINIQLVTTLKGENGYAARDNHSGGNPVSLIGMFGRGGDGANGVGDEGWSFGGGGASGSGLTLKYTNKTLGIRTLTFVIGEGGAGGTKGGFDTDVVGSKGSNGFVRVMTIG